MIRYYFFITAMISFCLFSTSCKKDDIITDSSAKLLFSTDTLTFDTVFSTRGSTTEFIRIFNPEKQRINISMIELAGGENSPYRISVDGVNGVRHENIEIPAEDSLYIFVEVTIDRDVNANLPFFVKDSITFITNGNAQDVKLVAWGQDAHYFTPDTVIGNLPPLSILTCNTTWTNDKPYAITGYLVVDSACTLTIQQGTRVHFANRSALLMFKSTLIVNGTNADSVTFQGDRLESFFDAVPGQWDGLQFTKGSFDNRFKHAVISGAINSISVNFASVNSNPNIELKNTVIKHSSGYGIFSLGSDITMENCLMYDAGVNLMLMGAGGNYDIKHCTFNSFGSFFNQHDDPAIAVSDFLQIGDDAFEGNLNASFQNCIINGSLSEEFSVVDNEEIPVDFNLNVENCLVRTEETASPYITNSILNENPQFVSTSEQNYHLSESSPAINAGINVGVIGDLDDKLRDSEPDLGCYEYSK